MTARSKNRIIVPDPCKKFKYPSMENFDFVLGTDGYLDSDGEKAELSRFYSDEKVFDEVGTQK
jgi:hypothetical protein